MLPRIEHCRVDQGILVDAKRSSARVGRGDNAQPVPALRRAEALLLVTWFETGLPGAQSNLEDVGSVYPRRIRFIVANAVSGGHALEFARLNHPGATH
jgi:hypothetical protein